MAKNNNGIYLLQRKNSIIQRCMMSFLVIYLAMFLVFFIPINIGAQGYLEGEIPTLIFLSIGIFLLLFPYFAMIMIVALFYKCNDRIEFNSIKNILIVNGVEHKILKTNAIKLLKLSRGELTSDPVYGPSILLFTLERNKKVNALSLLTPSNEYPEAFNFEVNVIYSSKSLILIYLTTFISIGLFMAFVPFACSHFPGGF